MPNWEKIAARANCRAVSTFAEPLTLPSGDTLSGVFDIPTEETRLKILQLDMPQPIVTLHDHDAERLNTNDQVIIRQQTFTVVKKKPDGTGLTVVHLSEQQHTINSENWL